ncbi:hypothetical protein BG004_001596 [Podila humilis]|nr:hypothetical protein BG004_001596 [Podila humilis]
MHRPSWIRWPLTVHIVERDIKASWDTLEARYLQRQHVLGSSDNNKEASSFELQSKITVTYGPVSDLVAKFSVKDQNGLRQKERERKRHIEFQLIDAVCVLCNGLIAYNDPSSYLTCSNEFEDCSMIAHLECLADYMLEQNNSEYSRSKTNENEGTTSTSTSTTGRVTEQQLLPTTGICKVCHCDLTWATMIRSMVARKDVLRDYAIDIPMDSTDSDT